MKLVVCKSREMPCLSFPYSAGEKLPRRRRCWLASLSLHSRKERKTWGSFGITRRGKMGKMSLLLLSRPTKVENSCKIYFPFLQINYSWRFPWKYVCYHKDPKFMGVRRMRQFDYCLPKWVTTRDVFFLSLSFFWGRAVQSAFAKKLRTVVVEEANAVCERGCENFRRSNKKVPNSFFFFFCEKKEGEK